MDRTEKFLVACVAWGTVSLTFLIIGGLYLESEKVKAMKAWSKPEIKLTLPQKCAQFYDDGTDRWLKCMGVDYKKVAE